MCEHFLTGSNNIDSGHFAYITFIHPCHCPSKAAKGYLKQLATLCSNEMLFTKWAAIHRLTTCQRLNYSIRHLMHACI